MAFKDGKHHHSMVKLDKKNPQEYVDSLRALADAYCTDDETPEEKAEFEAELAKIKAELEGQNNDR